MFKFEVEIIYPYYFPQTRVTYFRDVVIAIKSLPNARRFCRIRFKYQNNYLLLVPSKVT